MTKKKGNISDLLNKGDYIITTEFNNSNEEFIVNYAKIKGYFENKIRIEGYEIIPKGKGIEMLRMRLRVGIKTDISGSLVEAILLDKIDYNYIEKITDIDKKDIKIIDKKNYQFIEEWLKLNLPNLFSEYQKASGKEEKKIEKKIIAKLKKAKSPMLKKAVREALEIKNQ